jgi:hypothetical protein
MQNGDRFIGRVVSLNDDKLVLESDTLGTLRLMRAKVASITFGTGTRSEAAKTPPRHPAPLSIPAASTNGIAAPKVSTSHTIQQIQAQFLAGAGPEANNKFNELLTGLLSGRLSVGDIRVQAKSAVDQIRVMKRDLGSDAGEALDSYLTILDNFLKESDGDDPGTTSGSVTSAPKEKLPSQSLSQTKPSSPAK